ncbi:hypothetical protein D3C80_07110 [compost metagenome]
MLQGTRSGCIVRDQFLLWKLKEQRPLLRWRSQKAIVDIQPSRLCPDVSLDSLLSYYLAKMGYFREWVSGQAGKFNNAPKEAQ